MGLCDIVAQRHLVAARDSQLAALAPFPVRAQRNGWGLTRAPRVSLHPPFVPHERPPATLIPGLPLAARHREISGVLAMNLTTGTSGNSVSKPIPFPFQLVHLSLWLSTGANEELNRVQFWIVDNDSGSDTAIPLGTLIHDTAVRAAGLGNQLLDRSMNPPGAAGAMLNITVPQISVWEIGKRIAMHARWQTTLATNLTALWVARELLPNPGHVSTLPVPELAA